MSGLSKIVLVFISWTAEIRGVQAANKFTLKLNHHLEVCANAYQNALVAEENSAQKIVAGGCNRQDVLKT